MLEIASDPHREVIMEGSLSKFMDKSSNIVSKYLVLNSVALFIYKDDIAYTTFPKRPSAVMPLTEIQQVESHTLSPQEQQAKNRDLIYVLDVVLKQSYSKIVSNITDFRIDLPDEANKKDKKGAKQQSMPQQNKKGKGNQDGKSDISFHFIDADKNYILKWFHTLTKYVEQAKSRLEKELQAGSALSLDDRKVIKDALQWSI